MKLECDKKIIESAIIKASRLATKHLTLPVLACVYLETVGDNKLLIKATNLDIGIEIEVKVKVLETGSIVVPANIILASINSIKETKLLFEEVEKNLRITSETNSVVIKSMPSDDFPSIPKLKTGQMENKVILLRIKMVDFINGFKSVWYSASNSNIKPELGSVYVYQGENGLVFVSTDSFRLAEKQINFKSENDFPKILIPYRNVTEIIKLFEDYNEEIEVVFDKNQVAFMTDNFYLVSRLIDGSFPDYKQIIPKNFITTVTVLKSDLVNSLKSSNIFSDSLNQVKFKVDLKNKTLLVESKNNDIGEYKESIKANVIGEQIELSFNNRYIVDCMQSISSDSLVLSFGGQGKPLLIQGLSDKAFSYIVMPMNR